MLGIRKVAAMGSRGDSLAQMHKASFSYTKEPYVEDTQPRKM